VAGESILYWGEKKVGKWLREGVLREIRWRRGEKGRVPSSGGGESLNPEGCGRTVS